MPPGFDRIKSILIMMISLQKLVISGVKGLLDVDGIKLIDKDDQAANTLF